MKVLDSLKILFIHNNYANNNSGEEHAAEALKKVLEANGHQVRWFRRFSDVINNSFSKKVQAFFSGIYNPSAVRELKVLLDDFQPDVVQVQNLYPFISPGIVKTIKRRGIPLVMRCPNYRLFCPTGLHLDRKGKICEQCLSGSRELNCLRKNCEDDLAKSFGYALRNFVARTFWKVTETMDAYIVQTAFQRQKFIDNGIPAEKLFIIPGLVPDIKTVHQEESPKYVTFIGRISEEKGILEFLEAAKLLPDIPFVVVGGLSELGKALTYGSPKNVVWRGFVSGKALEAVYTASRMVVVPSKWYEGFPNVITQAMKHGKPVITSNLGAMSNIIDHDETGLLVPPGDSLALAKAIKDLYLNESKATELGENAFNKAKMLYNSSKVYDELIVLYETLLIERTKNKKKILAILHYPPPVHGAAMMGRYIMESKSINTAFKTKYINLGTSVRVDEIGSGGWLKVKRYLLICTSTLSTIILERPHLVYITLTASGSGFYKDALIAIMVKIFGLKVVYHFHNKGVILRQNKWLDNQLYKIVFKNASVILLSKYLYNDIKKYVPEERVHYCPNGIPTLNSVPARNELSDTPTELLFLSNLIASKGVFDVLSACKILKEKKYKFKCTFIGNVGDIPLDTFHEKIKSLGLEHVVCYAGPKFGIEKENAYMQSGIFVFPTFYEKECFPLVLLEAMKFGLPVIATAEGGIPEIVEEAKTGFLVNKKDPTDLAEKIMILIKNEDLRKKMGVESERRFEEHFTLDAFEVRFKQILEKLVK